MNIINYKKYDEDYENNVFNKLIVKDDKGKEILLKELPFISITKELRLYYLKNDWETLTGLPFDYSWCVIQDVGYIYSDINNNYEETKCSAWEAKTGYVERIAEGKFTDWDGIRHSNYFDNGYANYINEEIDMIIKMFQTIRDCQKYMEDNKTLEGFEVRK